MSLFAQVAHRTAHWHSLKDGRIQCDICPRGCRLREGQRGFCFVRMNNLGEVVLTTYGRTSGLCVDPIEKKPLYHFLPGSTVLSFGTAGCNLACQFCQNWHLSKSRSIETASVNASPEEIAKEALRTGCRSVAFTYNDPVIFHEFAIDTAAACRERGINTVAVTAGYQQPTARREFFRFMDAANVDLKGFSDDFYRRLCGGHLPPVLDTLRFLINETDVWVEITTLLIPGENDSDDEIHRECEWIASQLGLDVPLHFSAFHPAWHMMRVPPTPPSALTRARFIARQYGLRYVYTGNVHDAEGGRTICHKCGSTLIARDWHSIESFHVDNDGRCRACGTRCAGVFEGTQTVSAEPTGIFFGGD